MHLDTKNNNFLQDLRYRIEGGIGGLLFKFDSYCKTNRDEASVVLLTSYGDCIVCKYIILDPVLGTVIYSIHVIYVSGTAGSQFHIAFCKFNMVSEFQFTFVKR